MTANRGWRKTLQRNDVRTVVGRTPADGRTGGVQHRRNPPKVKNLIPYGHNWVGVGNIYPFNFYWKPRIVPVSNYWIKEQAWSLISCEWPHESLVDRSITRITLVDAYILLRARTVSCARTVGFVLRESMARVPTRQGLLCDEHAQSLTWCTPK